ILSRTAELRELAEQAMDLDQQISQRERGLEELAGRVAELESRVGQHDILQSTLTEQSRHFEIVLRQNRQRLSDLEKQRTATTEELTRVDRDIKQVDESCVRIASDLRRVHEEIKTSTDRKGEVERLLADRESASRALEEGLQAARIEAAKMDERLSASSEQKLRLAVEMQSRERDVSGIVAELRADQTRADELNRRMLASRSELASLYRLKDLVHAEPGHDPASLQALRDERRVLREHITAHRKEIDDAKNLLHAHELQATELRLQRETMAARILEDYGIVIEGSIEEEYVPPAEDQLVEARGEVEGLRDRIARLGSVNASAIQDLDDLELRCSTFAYQISDLTTAKRHLEEVIGKINEESRRLFLDTFETVREHFQDLFRKLFGGGKADILLEDDTDVLESGIEIIARPPGKEPRSISLLSGGEKTMTAVALLMALFRSKPTPFCILDEVDAALDEANISRFVASLREFLDRSQFILITHSKTTMASADVLHGVTQRESGVSIRVSVRLDDVTEDGHIVERSESAQAS
ncbi:MAG: AAA family ATPase, partial [Planctomycetota bacterium]